MYQTAGSDLVCLGAPYGPTIDSSCIWDRSGIRVVMYLAVINRVINFYYKNYYIVLKVIIWSGGRERSLINRAVGRGIAKVRNANHFGVFGTF